MYQEQQVNRLHRYRKLFGSLVLGVGWLFSSGCATEFFVDKGLVDAVSGISFEIKPPYLNEKKAFNLRAENLSPWQLQQISEAMPFIAAFTYAQLGNGVSPALLPVSETKVRSIRHIQNLNSDTFLAVKPFKTGKSQRNKSNSTSITFTQGKTVTLCSSETTIFLKQTSKSGCLKNMPRQSQRAFWPVKKALKAGVFVSHSIGQRLIDFQPSAVSF
jgi:hypothetical protein